MLNQFYLAHPEQFHATFLVQRRLPNNGLHIAVLAKSELCGTLLELQLTADANCR